MWKQPSSPSHEYSAGWMHNASVFLSGEFKQRQINCGEKKKKEEPEVLGRGHFWSASCDSFSFPALHLLTNTKQTCITKWKRHLKLTDQGGHLKINVLCSVRRWRRLWYRQIMNVMPFCCSLRDDIQRAVKCFAFFFSFYFFFFFTSVCHLHDGAATFTVFWKSHMIQKNKHNEEAEVFCGGCAKTNGVKTKKQV